MKTLVWSELDEAERRGGAGAAGAAQRPGAAGGGARDRRRRARRAAGTRCAEHARADRRRGAASWSRSRRSPRRRGATLARRAAARRSSSPRATSRAFHEASRAGRASRSRPCRASASRKLWRPIDRVGLYVPGGATPLFSTLLMLAHPGARRRGRARSSSSRRRGRDGGLDPAIALAAELCGIEAIWTVGGAQAIAALAFGAGDIPRGRQDLRPRQCLGRRGQGAMSRRSPAARRSTCRPGPSELMVIADASADPRLVAADLLSQAEHDADGAGAAGHDRRRRWPTRSTARSTARSPTCRARRSPTRRSATRRILVADDLDEAVDDRQSLCARASVARGRRSRRAGRRDPQRRRDLRRAMRGRDVRRLSRRVEPRPADRRRGARVERRLGPQLHEGDHRPARHAPRPRARIAAPAAALARLEGLEAHARAAEARLERRGMTALAAAPRPPRDPRAAAVRHSASANAAFGPTRSGSTPTRIPFAPLVEGALAAGINRYPEPQPARLRAAMAALYGVAPGQSASSPAAPTMRSTCSSAPSAGPAMTRSPICRADLLRLRPFRPAPGRAGDRGAARRRFRLRCRRVPRRGRATSRR